MATQISAVRQDLLNSLTQIQNHPIFSGVDILSITGCGMTDSEVRAHIERQFKTIEQHNFEAAQIKPRRRNATRH